MLKTRSWFLCGRPGDILKCVEHNHRRALDPFFGQLILRFLALPLPSVSPPSRRGFSVSSQLELLINVGNDTHSFLRAL